MNFRDGTVPDGIVDRALIQQHITAIESRVRRRLCGKFRAIARGHYDLDDVIASVRRRIDQAALQRRALPRTEEELYAYVLRVAEHVACDAVRRESRQRMWRAFQSQSPPGAGLEPAAPGRDDGFLDLQVVVSHLDPRDRDALDLIARGLSHAQAATATGASITAHQSRWRRLLVHLRVVDRRNRDGLDG